MTQDRKNKRAYLNDFEPDKEGSYAYQGKIYAYEGTPRTYRKILIRLWTDCIAALAALTVCGCIPAEGMSGCFYVLLPYVAGLICAAAHLASVWKLTRAGLSLREYVYEDLNKELPVRAMAGVVCCGITIVGELIYLFRNAWQNLAFSLLFLTLELIAVLCCLGIKRRFEEMTWTLQK